MIYCGRPRENKDGTTSVQILSTITVGELRELGIVPVPDFKSHRKTEEDVDQKGGHRDGDSNHVDG